MFRIHFFERVMAIRARKITFCPFVGTDGHGEIGERVPLSMDLELLVPAERCPFHVNLISTKHFFESFENRECDLRRPKRAREVGIGVNQHFSDFEVFQSPQDILVCTFDDLVRIFLIDFLDTICSILAVDAY